MKKNTIIGGVAALSVCVLVGIAWNKPGVKEETDTPITKTAKALEKKVYSTPKISSLPASKDLILDEKDEFELQQDYLLEAFEAHYPDELAKRVRELLEKDFEQALEVFATLDYTFLHYKMAFPHDEIADYLEENYQGPQVMEVFSEYIDQSSILNSVVIDYFERWMESDPVAQYEWIKENSSFTEPRIIEKYAMQAGALGNGYEVVQLIAELPEDDFRRDLLHQVALDSFSHAQPAQFAQYINTLEEIPEYANDSVFNLAESFLYNQGYSQYGMEQALEWINRVESPQQYWSYLASLAGTYKYKSPKQFEQWAASYEFKFDDEQGRKYFETNIEAEYAIIAETDSPEYTDAPDSSPFE